LVKESLALRLEDLVDVSTVFVQGLGVGL